MEVYLLFGGRGTLIATLQMKYIISSDKNNEPAWYLGTQVAGSFH